MRVLRLLAGFAVTAALAGCAEASKPVASAGPAPVAAPKISSVPPKTTHDTQGRLVTLTDLTKGNTAYGQEDVAMADSTPGAIALGGDGEDPSSPENFEIVGSELKGKIAVLHVGSARTDANLLSISAGVKNQTGHRLPLEMQTIYRDKTGRSLTNGVASWVPITLKPHEETQYRSVALSEEATDFIVRIRHAPIETASH